MTQYTIESYTSEGWDDEGFFTENSTVYNTIEEAEGALQDAIDFAKKEGFMADFVESLHINTIECDDE